jgi:hypothetical protein
MKKLRNLMCILLGLVVTAFALPGAAQNGKKIYNLDISSSAGPPYTITAKFLNKSPGNSSFSSVNLSVTGLVITGATSNRGVVQPNPFPAGGTTSVNVVTIEPPVKPGETLTLTLQVSSCGDGAWSARAFTGSPLVGQQFGAVNLDFTPEALPIATPLSCGNLACGAGQGEGGPIAVPDTLNPGDILVERGTWDKNGTQPADVCAGTGIAYFVTNNVDVNDQVHFRWPVSGDGSDSAAAFQFTVFGEGPIPAITNVAWFNKDGSPASSPGTPDFIPGLPCNAYANFLPTPYGTLISDNGTDTLHVDTTVGGVAAVPVASVPFDVFIENERLTISAVDATNIADEIWTVSARNVGGVVGTVPHTAANLLVMSEPLPIMTITQGAVGEYVANHQAQMCISDQEESDNDGGELGDESGEPSPTDHSTTFIDIGDGWGGHP